MDWSNETSIALIEQYHRQSVLWNSRHGYHNSKTSRQVAWEAIARNMQSSVDEVKQKMNSLLGSFRRERSKMRRAQGRDGYGSFSSTWFAFDSMYFLIDRHEDNKIYIQDLKMEKQEEEEDVAFESDTDLLEEELKESSEEALKGVDRRVNKLNTTRSSDQTVFKHLGNSAIDDFHALHNQDECSSYAQYVVSKMRKFDARTRLFVEQAIHNVLFEADLGKYSDLSSPFGTNQVAKC